MFLQKKTTFNRALKSFQQCLVSICVVFNFFFYYFFSLRSGMKSIYTSMADMQTYTVQNNA